MTGKEQLWYLINGVLDGSYDIKTFCLEFTRIYDLEVDYDKLSEQENSEFGDLCGMAGRFSDDEEELKIPHMYYSEEQILDKARNLKKNYKIIHIRYNDDFADVFSIHLKKPVTKQSSKVEKAVSNAVKKADDLADEVVDIADDVVESSKGIQFGENSVYDAK